MIITMIIVLIPMLLFSISCSQKESGHGGEVEQVRAEAGEKASEGEGEHASRDSGEHTSSESGEHASRESGEHGPEGEGEHGGKEGEGSHGEEGEESGTRYTLNQTCEEVRKGVLLNLKYDKSSSTFTGTVKNISKEAVKRVRVEVHLSNKVELGPTKALDLAPGKQAGVKLSAKDQTFTWWSAHAESGDSEH
jgi:hypothetical protein